MKTTQLLQKINTSTFIEDLLTAYGVQDVGAYLSPTPNLFESPWDYPNMEMAVLRLHTAISSGEQVVILHDPDGDGVMSTTIAYDFLKSQGTAPLVLFHTGKQHGLSVNEDENIVEQVIESGATFLWIPDAGSGNVKECKHLTENGIDVLVTDHHNVDKPNPYCILVNHHLENGLNTQLTGAGVTAKVVQAYCERYGVEQKDYSDLVAFSIVSDVSSLLEIENRAYLHEGLFNWNTEKVNPFLFYLNEKLNQNKTLNPKAVSWNLAPKINAVCRSSDMEAKKTLFKAFVGEHDMEDALRLSMKCHREQTKIVKEIYDEIIETIDQNNKVIVCFGDKKDRAYLGLVANKLMGEFNKPTIILRELNENTYSGSVRSPVPLLNQINESGLADCQGHQEAFGIVVKKNKLNKLIKWFDGLDLETKPPIQVTASITPRQATIKLARLCESHSHIWANGVPAPTFYMTGTITGSKVNVYRKKTNTAKLNIDGVDFIKFRCSDEEAEMFEQIKKAEIEMIVTLSINEFRGNISVQGTIEEYKILPVKSKKIESASWEELF